MVREKTIERVIREFIANELTMSPENVHLEDNLVNDLHADSMDIVNIVTAIESRFKIKFPNDSDLKYDGYTMQFLVVGTKRALKEKNPVHKAARKMEAGVDNKIRNRKSLRPTSTTSERVPDAEKELPAEDVSAETLKGE